MFFLCCLGSVEGVSGGLHDAVAVLVGIDVSAGGFPDPLTDELQLIHQGDPRLVQARRLPLCCQGGVPLQVRLQGLDVLEEVADALVLLDGDVTEGVGDLLLGRGVGS
jgi:hypothetical protein